MAIDAADFAESYLPLDGLKRISPSYHFGYIQFLLSGINMIEFKNHWIVLSAINARMLL